MQLRWQNLLSNLCPTQARYERSALEAGTVLFGEIAEGDVPGVAATCRKVSYSIGASWYLEQTLLEEHDRVVDAFGIAPADSTAGPP